MTIYVKSAARPHDSATQAEPRSEVIDLTDRAAPPPMSCVDCCAMFGDGFAAAEHARRHSHLVAIDYRPTERWRAELRAKNLSIAAAAQALASSDRGIPR